jgi:hypothetical protein
MLRLDVAVADRIVSNHWPDSAVKKFLATNPCVKGPPRTLFTIGTGRQSSLPGQESTGALRVHGDGILS